MRKLNLDVIINFYPIQFDIIGGPNPGASTIGFIQQTGFYYSVDLSKLIPNIQTINSDNISINLKYSKYY